MLYSQYRLSFEAQNFTSLSYERIHSPKLSAECWSLMDTKNGEIICSKKGSKKRKIISLTMMMTKGIRTRSLMKYILEEPFIEIIIKMHSFINNYTK